MNKVILIGNLTRDPELSETNSGISVCRFGLAVNRAYSSSDGERETDFFNITAWRGTGENVAKYCKKGSKVSIVGSLQVRQYEDKEGVKRTATDIIAQEVEFLTHKSRNDEDYGAPPPEPAKKGRANLEPIDDDDDLPF